jgi:AraC-like DNA-binding protein
MTSLSSAADVLQLDPELGTDIVAAERPLAHRLCRAQLVDVGRGRLGPAQLDGVDEPPVALLIVEGVVGREMRLRDRYLLELLGRGDVLQLPADEAPGAGRQLTIIDDLQMLVLGESFVRAAGRWPSLLVQVLARLEGQRESLATQALIARLPNAEHRLLLMLEHLIARWGEPASDGVALPWALSHEVLGQLIGARRSTLSLAAKSLEAAGEIRRRADGGWLLTEAGVRTARATGRSWTDMPSLAERLMLHRRADRLREESSALIGEARQARARRASISLGPTAAADGRPPDPPPATSPGAHAGRPGARSSALGRAIAFIETHASTPITIDDIARAAGVTPRALQYAFARHLDTTPLGYLRGVRLACAHRELQVAAPGRVTVSQVAQRWGFAKPSRFAGAYRAAYGRPPSQTLRG